MPLGFGVEGRVLRCATPSASQAVSKPSAVKQEPRSVSTWVAYSGERDQPFWLMVITCFGDRDHARRGGVGPWRTAASDASAGGYSLAVSGGTGQGRAGG